MSYVGELIKNLRVGTHQEFEGLTVTPLLTETVGEAGYIVLDQALAKGEVIVREVNEEGNVPELALDNRGGQPILAVDGEELVGAKQNRILNLTILAPSGRVWPGSARSISHGGFPRTASKPASGSRAPSAPKNTSGYSSSQ